MRKLMAAAAAVGVAAVTTRGTAQPNNPPDAPASATPSASTSPANTSGYMVVDPVPPPANRGCGCGKPGADGS